MNQWCFLDERVDANAFDTICHVPYSKNMNDVVDVWLSLIKTNGVAFFITIIAVIQSIAIIYIFFRLNFQNQILVIGNIGGSILLIAYLCEKGRLPLRAYAVVVIPMMMFNSFIIISKGKVSH